MPTARPAVTVGHAEQGSLTRLGGGPPGAAAAAGVSEVLEDLAEAALRTGGEVIVLGADRTAAKSRAAAVFRY